MPQVKSQAIWSEFRGILASNAANAEAANLNQYPSISARTKHPKSGWCGERVDLLKKLWADGLSASQIARKIGEVTRNAVIGKIHRLGLTCPNAARRVPRGPTVKRAARIQFPKAPPPAVTRPPARILKPVLGPAPEGAITLANIGDLTETMCHWPNGDPREGGFHFCARRKDRKAAYCEHHAAIACAPRIPRQKSTAGFVLADLTGRAAR